MMNRFSKIFILCVLCFASCKATEQLQFQLYYESFCGGCQQEIIDELSPIMSDKEMKPLINMTFYPAGNVNIVSRDPIKITCQHGDVECLGNKLEGCAINKNPEFDNWFNFIYCMEYSGQAMVKNETVLKCAEESKINGNDILTCAYSEEGDKIHLWNADQTPADHQWVPWTVINNKLFDGDSVLDGVCAELKSPKPALCGSSMRKNLNSQRCEKSTLKNEVPKVNFTVYIESLHKDCKQEVVDALEYISEQTELQKIMNIDIIPFGNAKIINRNPIEIQCENGDVECRGNMALSCGMKLYPNYNTYYEFMYCIEFYNFQNFTDSQIAYCSAGAHMNFTNIINCVNGTEGLELLLEAGDKTGEHETLPTNLVNGKPVTYYKIVDEICAAYEGEKPDVCGKSIKYSNKMGKFHHKKHFRGDKHHH